MSFGNGSPDPNVKGGLKTTFTTKSGEIRESWRKLKLEG
ncbi:hypothetical protein TRICHSKD4_2231 [Roseibium sp. TrichSKD4]|nr:hypothetical protein TRICHSKD4_2231 [Roseibium sp. TrichSKD4]